MTDAELAAIRERCEAATEGPWEKFTERWLGVWQDIRVVAFDGKYIICGDTVIADAEFIAAARTDVPALLDEVERLRMDLGLFRSENDDLRVENERLRAKVRELDDRLHPRYHEDLEKYYAVEEGDGDV